MPTTNTRLRDAAVDHEVDLRRYSETAVRRMLHLLERADARLTAQIAEALLRLDRGSFTIERLDALLASVRATSAQAYAALFDELREAMRGLAEVEAAAAHAQLASTVPAPVQARIPLVGVAAEQVYAAAMARPFQGRLLAGWAATLETRQLATVQNAVRLGYVTGETTADIVRRIRGTKALGFKDGVLARSRREVATVVNTALSHTAQTARQAVVDANADLVKGVQWVSTLDQRTSPPCRIRDGLVYAPKTHKPIGHKIPWGDGPGRLHFNCRSTSVPVLKSYKELGLDIEDLPAGTRASMDGQVPADLKFGDWLLKQSPTRQDEILGPTRGRLLREGRLKLPDFYDGKGRPLTLAELRAKLG